MFSVSLSSLEQRNVRWMTWALLCIGLLVAGCGQSADSKPSIGETTPTPEYTNP